MCYKGGKFCIRTAMKICHTLSYNIQRSCIDESGKFHLFKLTIDDGSVLYFDYNTDISKYLLDKYKRSK